jgi:hypothetical protein
MFIVYLGLFALSIYKMNALYYIIFSIILVFFTKFDTDRAYF